MPPNRLLVLKAGMPPVRGEKIVYWREKALADRVAPPPIISPLPSPGAARAVPAEPVIPVSDKHDPLTLEFDMAAWPAVLPPLREGATEEEVETWVEHFIDASAQPREVNHVR